MPWPNRSLPATLHASHRNVALSAPRADACPHLSLSVLATSSPATARKRFMRTAWIDSLSNSDATARETLRIPVAPVIARLDRRSCDLR